jgi:hypothetical protein
MKTPTTIVSAIIIIAVFGYFGLQYHSANNVITSLNIQMYGIPETSTVLLQNSFDIQLRAPNPETPALHYILIYIIMR